MEVRMNHGGGSSPAHSPPHVKSIHVHVRVPGQVLSTVSFSPQPAVDTRTHTKQIDGQTQDGWAHEPTDRKSATFRPLLFLRMMDAKLPILGLAGERRYSCASTDTDEITCEGMGAQPLTLKIGNERLQSQKVPSPTSISPEC
ncbi:hypothetical protein TEQG_05085 [Trichophyton equinum CBS 127.97]|uniref:Uncharacterized protein n=1 Tax=Trichophyton equinum (strain ATCC MYA-4606 / CBS 127.97) TaxID=559882 RepID=F2PWC0_TRIEC|nr:hypothetical protein TEQG_05085 [Trichophyton equinum CBS 127.97]